MAMIQLNTGKYSPIAPTIARRLWFVFTGEKKGTQAEVAKLRKIRRFYFNPDNAPESWKKRYKTAEPEKPLVASGLSNQNIRMPYKDD